MTCPAEEREKLLRYLATIGRPGKKLESLSDQTDLVACGFIDSLAVIEIILYLEDRYGINVRAATIDPAKLVTVEGILKSIERAR